jgi:hypothetical protein
VDVKARTTLGRALAVWLSVGMVQMAVPAQAAPAADPAPDRSARHLLNQEQVARRLLESAQTREQRIKLFQDALATSEAQKRARLMGADPDRLRAAVPHLSDRELADLAARATQAKDVAAGHGHGYGGGEEALIIVGVALLVTGIILIAAAAEDCDDWGDCDYDYDYY